MKITNCKVNHLFNPLGFSMRETVFSFTVEASAGTRLTEARLIVTSQGEAVADTGWTAEVNPRAWRVNVPLTPRTAYAWTVAVRTDAGEEAVSEVSAFETALMDEAWTGRWLTCDKGTRLPIFRKRIDVPENLASARLYICGLGLYEARLNGEKIGDEYFAPYCNNYEAWVQYQTCDVTEQLRTGGDLSVMLGDGWYMSRFGFMSRLGDPGLCGEEYKLIAQVAMVDGEGRETIIGTDDTWTVTRSNITFTSIYDGEHRDDTLPSAAIEKPRYAQPPKGKLTARWSLPVKAQETWQPIELIRTPRDEMVFDLGQNFAGIFRLRVHEPAGTQIRIQVGEVLQEGCFYRDNLRTALAEYRCISDGKETIIEPVFTFYGCRYVKVEGIPDLRIEDFTAVALYSDLPETGCIETGHEKVNQLIRNAHWGLRSNFLDVPTDCPQRDERMGWTGDAQVFSPTACYLREGYAFFGKYLHDMASEQAALAGKVPVVVPALAAPYRTTATVWGDAATIIPWNLYRMYGSTAILAEQYESMKSWVDFLTRLDGDNHHWREVFHYGDWLALDNPRGMADEVFGGTEEGYIADIYYAHSARIVAKSAHLLGKPEDAAHYEALAERILAEMRDEYFSPNGRCCISTQTAQILALHYPGVTVNREKAADRLRACFRETGGQLRTGFVGTPLLCGTLCEIGESKLAYDLLLREEYPGWLYEVNLGATTIWERWNSLSPDGSVSSTGMNSFNHYAYGSIVQWLFEYAAGVQPDESQPGFAHAVIKPHVDERLGHLDMKYASASGEYRVKWAFTADGLTLHVEVPFGCTAALTLPVTGEELALTPGAYDYALPREPIADSQTHPEGWGRPSA